MDYKSISKIYLASKSPRRSELFSQMGINFTVLSLDVAEEVASGETYLAYSERICLDKARAGWEYIYAQNLPRLPDLSIQGYAGQFIQKIDGCFYGVTGLPLNLVQHLLHELADHVN